MNDAVQYRMSDELVLVRSKKELKTSIYEFNTTAGDFRDRARALIRQTTYWVYDIEECFFGPAKFVGFAHMNLPLYERALAGRADGDRFDGNVTKSAIEALFELGFETYIYRYEALMNWGESLLGQGVFEGVDHRKWQILDLWPERHFWAFLSKPNRYRVMDAIRELREDSWLVRDSDVKAGDRVAIWKAKGRDKNRGVVALAEVLTDPATYLPPPSEAKFWIDPESVRAERRVRVRYVIPKNLPLWLEDEPISAPPSMPSDLAFPLRRLTVSRATGGTIFKISVKHWISLLNAAGGWPLEQSSAEVRPEVAEKAVRDASTGQGFSGDPYVRITIEQRAMDLAKSYFIGHGWKVEVKGKPYDLLCMRDSEILHVEVKGTQTMGDSVLLTPNEVTFAKQNIGRMALFVVTNISIDMQNGQPVAKGGDQFLIDSWIIDEEDLTPTGYLYKVPRSQE